MAWTFGTVQKRLCILMYCAFQIGRAFPLTMEPTAADTAAVPPFRVVTSGIAPTFNAI